MPTRFIHDGASIDYTPPAGSPVTAGDVIVQGDLVGVAKRDIAAQTLGALAVEGVFDFPKASAAGGAIPTGSLAYWDAANQVATVESSAGKLIGKTIRDASDSDTTVRIRMQ